MSAAGRRVRWALLVGLGMLPPRLGAQDQKPCPAYMEASRLPPTYYGQPLNSLQLFYQPTEGTFAALPFQWVPLDHQDLLRKTTPGTKISRHDRLMVAADQLRRIETTINKVTLPQGCRHPVPLTQSNSRKRSKAPPQLMLALCKQPAKAAPSPVARHDKQGLLSSSQFHFEHVPGNLLLFNKISLRSKNGVWQRIAADADLWMHLDVKNFFDVDLDRSNLYVELAHLHQGAAGIAHELQFRLQILLFNIDLDLGSLFSFFADSAHSPMKVTVPVDAPKYLNPGSGMLLHWKPLDSQAALKHPLFNLPIAKPEQLKPRGQVPEEVLRSCSTLKCRFNLVMAAEHLDLVVQMRLNPANVRRHFYPQWVPDVESFVKAAKWLNRRAAKAYRGRSGVFYANHQLPEGSHEVDYWFYPLPKGSKGHSCPKHLAVSRARLK